MTTEQIPSFWHRHKDRLISMSMAVLIVYTIIRNVARASERHLWYDELCTWIITTLPSASSVWAALLRAADSMPPSFYVLESFMGTLIPNQQIAFRILSILAVGATVWFLFVWMRRRFPAERAFVAALIPFLTVFDSYYSVEARSYALTAACLAFAILSYDRVPTVRWTISLALALLLAECMHYYALIAMAPFFAAEALYTFKQNKVRWQVWAAFACGVAPLIVLWPLLASLKAYYGKTFWAKVTLEKAAGVYGWLWGNGPGAGATQATVLFAIVVAIASLGTAICLLWLSLRSASSESKDTSNVLVAVFLLLPFVFYAVTKITQGGFTERYALATILGVILAGGIGISRLSRRAFVLIAVGLAVCFVSQESAFWLSFRVARELKAYNQHPMEEMINAAGYRNLPVMVTGANDYLQLVYYSEPRWKLRIYSVVDPETGLKYGIPDSGDKELQVFRDLMPLNVMDYADFRRRYPEFLVYSIPFRIPWMNDPDWWVLRLKDDGYIVTTLKTDGRHSVYLAQRTAK